MSMNNKTAEYHELVCISKSMQSEYAEENKQWTGSPFEWIKYRPSRSIGAIGEKIVSAWLALHDFSISRSPDTEADRIVEGIRVEIKFSTLWKNGTYLFEQIRDQNYEIAIFLGISPNDAHCWVIPKRDLMRLWKEEHRISSQHGGHSGSDTAWARLSPDKSGAPDDIVLSQYGNGLHEALVSLARFTGFSLQSFTCQFDMTDAYESSIAV